MSMTLLPPTAVQAESAQMSTGQYAPVQIITLEIGRPLPLLSAAVREDGQQYRKARLLVLLHDHPLGTVDAEFDDGCLYPSVYAARIWDALHEEILAHVQHDGLFAMKRLTVDGIPAGSTPTCAAERERATEHLPFASVILCTRDRPELLERSLHALVAQDYPHYEIIVVDNAPRTSATADVMARFADHPQVRYVLERRPGLSTARNRGIMEARGSVLAFTDDDTVPRPNWLESLVAGFRAADNVACVTGLTFPLALETETQFWFEEFGGFNKGYTRQIHRLMPAPERAPLHPYTAGRFGTGANMAFTARFLRSIGGFDAALGAGSPTGGGEDLFAFFKVLTAGMMLVYEPRAIVYHEHRRDLAALRKQIRNAGCGLVAYLLKVVDDDHARLFDIARRVPYGIFFAFSSSSPKNQHRSGGYPRGLAWLEVRGMLSGPRAYLQGRWRKHVTGGLRPFERTVKTTLSRQTIPNMPALER